MCLPSSLSCLNVGILIMYVQRHALLRKWSTQKSQIHHPWVFLWKAFPSTSSNQLLSCLMSGYKIICSFCLKKKKCFNSLTWDPNTLQSWKYTATGNSKSGSVFHNSTVLFRSISLYSAPRAFSTATHTPTCFPCCNTAKSFQCTLASDTWKCIVAVHCECQHLRNSHLFLT